MDKLFLYPHKNQLWDPQSKLFTQGWKNSYIDKFLQTNSLKVFLRTRKNQFSAHQPRMFCSKSDKIYIFNFFSTNFEKKLLCTRRNRFWEQQTKIFDKNSKNYIDLCLLRKEYRPKSSCRHVEVSFESKSQKPFVQSPKKLENFWFFSRKNHSNCFFRHVEIILRAQA